MIELFNTYFGVAPEGWEFIPYLLSMAITLYFVIAIFNVFLGLFKPRS